MSSSADNLRDISLGRQIKVKAKQRQKTKFLVGTGAIVFTQEAKTGKEALELVKNRLADACSRPPNPRDLHRLSSTLLETFAAGKLNFIVMDGERTALLCGEYQGVFEHTVSGELSTSLRHLIPADLEMNRRWQEQRLPALATLDEEPCA